MDRTQRFCTAVLLCAIAGRLWQWGFPYRLVSWLSQPNITAFVTYLETGRNVRFSASQEVFFQYAPESPPAATIATAPAKETLPVFSREDQIELLDAAGVKPDIPRLMEAPLTWDLTGKDPSVLILHTHTTESYTQLGENYVETSAYRTLDNSYNMLSIGDVVADILTNHGISVIQDRDFHDYPSYNGSYSHARKSIRQYLQEYPSIALILDLHRDALETGGSQLKTLASLDRTPCAQLMLVMGTNASGLKHDNWETNLSLALKLQVQLERQAPGIMRPIYLRSQRFNQDLSPGALLIEVGAAGNTHEEAKLAAEQLAFAIVALSKGTQ